MPKITFNPDAVSTADAPQDGDVREPNQGCAFEPVVVDKPGIQAIIEGLSLANIEGFKLQYPQLPAKDVDPC